MPTIQRKSMRAQTKQPTVIQRYTLIAYGRRGAAHIADRVCSCRGRMFVVALYFFFAEFHRLDLLLQLPAK